MSEKKEVTNIEQEGETTPAKPDKPAAAPFNFAAEVTRAEIAMRTFYDAQGPFEPRVCAAMALMIPFVLRVGPKPTHRAIIESLIAYLGTVLEAHGTTIERRVILAHGVVKESLRFHESHSRAQASGSLGPSQT